MVAFCSEECANAPARLDPAQPPEQSPKQLPAQSIAQSIDQSPQLPAAPATLAKGSFDTTTADAVADKVARLPAARLAGVPALAPERPRSNRRRQIIALSAAIMAGGMIITVINAISPSAPSDVSAASERATTVRRAARAPEPGSPQEAAMSPEAAGASAKAAPAPAPVAADPQVLFAQAKATLDSMLSSPSERVQRLAAMALSRTGDEKATAKLKELLEREVSELMKIDIAYALARAGDTSVTSHLREGLQDSRRDVRLEAARAFAKLGDDAGARVLRTMLPVSNHQMAAAEILARLGDPEAMEVLRELAAEKDTPAADKIRALVALGKAGDVAVREELAQVISGGSFHVGAAEALAILGDERAIPALTAQLASPSLQVMAALSLRRLGAEVSLGELALTLASEDDRSRVSAAEAILLLTGPKQLAERD